MPALNQALTRLIHPQGTERAKVTTMPIQLHEENGGRLINVQVSGKLEKADYEQFVPEFERLARQHGMAIFCKPFLKAEVRYFDHAATAVARSWLGEAW